MCAPLIYHKHIPQARFDPPKQSAAQVLKLSQHSIQATASKWTTFTFMFVSNYSLFINLIKHLFTFLILKNDRVNLVMKTVLCVNLSLYFDLMVSF